jgi:hypothetical protein
MASPGFDLAGFIQCGGLAEHRIGIDGQHLIHIVRGEWPQ